jgi:hypothetical protein
MTKMHTLKLPNLSLINSKISMAHIPNDSLHDTFSTGPFSTLAVYKQNELELASSSSQQQI